MPDDAKREMIESLWQIVIAFVDLGFDLNPHQSAIPDKDAQSCGQNLNLKAVLEVAVLQSVAPAEAKNLTVQPHNTPTMKEPAP